MHHKITLLGLTFFFALFVAIPAVSSPVLWRVDSTTTTLYLMGSIHVGRATMYPLPKYISRSFTRANTLVVEVDLMGAGAALGSAWMLLNSTLPGGQTIADLFDKNQLKRLKSSLGRFSLPYISVAKLKPWVIAIQLLTTALSEADYDTRLGVDLHFLRLAHRRHKRIIELESALQQLQLFDNLPQPDQLTFLTNSLKQLTDIGPELHAIIDAWKAGNQKKLTTLVLDPMRTEPNSRTLYQRMFVERNKRMAKRLITLLKKNTPEHTVSYFVVVGAGHFLGNQSILCHLSSAGYTLSRVKPEPALRHSTELTRATPPPPPQDAPCG